MKRILFLSHSSTVGPFRVGSHHLSRELAAQGHTVFHVSTPVSVAHRILRRGDADHRRASAMGPARDSDGVVHWIPRTIVPAGLAAGLDPKQIARGLEADYFDVVFLDQPLLWSQNLRDITDKLIYRPTDIYPGGTKAKLQRRAVADADGVCATSSEVLRRLDVKGHTPSLVLSNGVDYGHFRASASVRERRAIYVGALDDRFDIDAVSSLAEAYPDWVFDLYGPGSKFSGLRLPANVSLLGPTRYADLPRLLSTSSIGLLPLGQQVENLGRSPMKLYEYLASGLFVVSKETPVLKSNPNGGIYVYSDRSSLIASFAAAAAAAANDGENAHGVRLAEAESWGSKAAQLLGFVEDLP